ncbi:MAG TPA: hypothetical protein V6D15_25670 [Oculatellaceae cyanobacterium]|jgi:hypothetical protein
MTLEQIIEQAKQLTPWEKMLLEYQAISPDIQEALIKPEIKPRRSLLGICANLCEPPSAEDIEQIRQEIWSTFEREDI